MDHLPTSAPSNANAAPSMGQYESYSTDDDRLFAGRTLEAAMHVNRVIAPNVPNRVPRT